MKHLFLILACLCWMNTAVAQDDEKLGVPGTMALDFTSTDINGVELTLSDFKGKYVLLDFWASWCVPCRKGHPHLLDVYAKYKDKGFEIIGIADNDKNPDVWRKAVEDDGVGVWRHVLRGLDYDLLLGGNRDPRTHPKEIGSSKFNITAYPTKILIDPTGLIIARYSSNTEDLDQKLHEIFDKTSSPGN